MIQKIKAFLKKKILYLPLLPVLLVELVALKQIRSVYRLSENRPLSSGSRVLGSTTNFLLDQAMTRFLIVVMILLLVFFMVLIFESNRAKKIQKNNSFPSSRLWPKSSKKFTKR